MKNKMNKTGGLAMGNQTTLTLQRTIKLTAGILSAVLVLTTLYLIVHEPTGFLSGLIYMAAVLYVIAPIIAVLNCAAYSMVYLCVAGRIGSKLEWCLKWLMRLPLVCLGLAAAYLMADNMLPFAVMDAVSYVLLVIFLVFMVVLVGNFIFPTILLVSGLRQAGSDSKKWLIIAWVLPVFGPLAFYVMRKRSR